MLKAAGLYILIVYILVQVGYRQSFVSKLYLLNAAHTSFPFLWAAVLSLLCVAAVYSVVGALLIKVVVILLVMGVASAGQAARSMGDAVRWHVVLFVLHFFLLLVGIGEWWDVLIGLDTETAFSESTFIPFRATGLFDEPSTFGMTMLALILGVYLLTGTVRYIAGPLLTFSLPAMSYVLLLRFIEVFRTRRYVKYIVLLIAPALFYALYMFALDRESNVRFSPMMLRVNHYLLFFESEKIWTGNGFCAAYGKFDLAMTRDELRSLYLGNFKDAGQLLYIADRIGLVLLLLYVFSLFRRLKMHIFILFFLYLALSKIPYFSMTGIFLFMSLAIHLTRRRSRVLSFIHK